MGCAAAPPADDASAHAGPASPAATAIAGTPDPRSRSPERSPWFGHPRPRLLSLAARDSFFFPRTFSFPSVAAAGQAGLAALSSAGTLSRRPETLKEAQASYPGLF